MRHDPFARVHLRFSESEETIYVFVWSGNGVLSLIAMNAGDINGLFGAAKNAKLLKTIDSSPRSNGFILTANSSCSSLLSCSV